MEQIEEQVGGICGTVLSAVGASMSISDIQAIISIIVTVLGFLITLITTVIIPTYKKYKKAKKDGKITEEEFEEIIDTAKHGIDSLKDEKNEKK